MWPFSRIEPEAPSCSLVARPLRPCLYLELPLVSMELSRDGKNSTTSSPDRNVLAWSCTLIYELIAQRMLKGD